MADDNRRRAGNGKPVTIDAWIDADERDAHRRQQRSCEPALADVDQHDPEGEGIALGPQRIRAACIAAAELANIDAAAQLTDDQTADQCAEQVGEQRFEAKFKHGQSVWV